MSGDRPFLFEVSWEVCNKVGGINTVIRSKAPEAMAAYGDRYLTIGPLMMNQPEFEESQDRFYGDIVRRLKKRNIHAKFGHWRIEGHPRVLLIDFKDAFPRHDEILYNMWVNYGVDSMFGGWDYVEPVLFSTACGIAIETIARALPAGTEKIAHFHEWMTGAGLLYLKKNVPEVSTVFTTHATILGRSMSGNNIDIYARLDEINPLPEAKRFNVMAKHSMESVCAREADCFTAVSGITAREAKALLGTPPDIVTPNGFNIDTLPDVTRDDGPYRASHDRLLKFAGAFLERNLDPARTQLISISGRYEFHNKGIDVLLESLARLNAEMKETRSDLTVVCLLLVLGGNVGVTRETRQKMRQSSTEVDRFAGISTHHLGDPQNDPIVTACRRLQLANGADDRCNIIFVPVNLDGRDGVLNMEYYDIIRGCDLGVYPSHYEPWGYTPHESVAYGVPTITTDKAGFGIWVRESFTPGQAGAQVIERFGRDDAHTITQLTEALRAFTRWSEADRQAQVNGTRAIAAQAGWRQFFAHYRDAYAKAATTRDSRVTGLKEEAREIRTTFTGTNSSQPRFRPFSVISSLPEELGRLRELANNLWWVWNAPARDLFSRLDPVLWNEISNNPVLLLEMIDRDKLTKAVANANFMSAYHSVLAAFDGYLKDTTAHVAGLRRVTAAHPVAYFSMEFGIHESIPTYSGGLGVLSGDHLKSASDLNLPLVGVSLLYKFGYFQQRINKAGEQVALFVQNNFAQIPIEIVQLETGEKVHVAINFPGRTVKAQVWRARVGRVTLYFLDTDVDENASKDREITDKLYDAETRERVEQEILLGIGGVQLLRELDIEASVYHLNEGHSAFLLIERIICLMKDHGLDFDTAREAVRSSTVFTTHTPVPAGNERFERPLIENYFHSYIKAAGLEWDQFWNLGHIYGGDDGPFDMTVCALKLACRSNGVSRLHGQVSRGMWQKIWNGFTPEEAPIGHVTNGVHAPSWVADDMKNLFETFAAIKLETAGPADAAAVAKIDTIPDQTLWRTHLALKDRLFDTVKAVLQRNWTREGEEPGLWDRVRARLKPHALTIGFARRFAPYKRPTLLVRDIERLRRIVSNDQQPVQFLFAGKAHPADRAGATLIQEIVKLAKREEFLGRIIFLENYDISLSRRMVAGVDVWLNNPIRPLEASGTSGMKAAINGVLNCSILDGWWDEAFDGSNGWAIGRGLVYENHETQELVDAENLFAVLEQQVIPLYFKRNAQEIPEGWVRMMKNAIKTVLPHFNMARMLGDYVRDIYEPAADYRERLWADDFALAGALANWKKKLPGRFSTLHINEVRVKGLEGDALSAGGKIVFKIVLDKGTLDMEEIQAEVVIQDARCQTGEPFCSTERMKLSRADNNLLTFEAALKPEFVGQFRYGIRVMPRHDGMGSKYESGLVIWG